VVLQNVFAPQVSIGGQREELVQRDRALAVRANNRHGGTQRQQHRRQIRWMHNVRWAAAEDCVVLVLSGGRVAFAAAFLQADNFFQTKVPAARALTEISAYSTEVANLWRSH